MSRKLYGKSVSPPVRSTLMALKAVGVEAEVLGEDMTAEEVVSPEFLKANPLHTIPTLQDGDFAIWDSHVINGYLVGRYGKDDSLYPGDIRKRAVVDQRMFFDCGIVFPRLYGLISFMKTGAKSLEKDAVEKIVEAYGQLELLLEKGPYVTGETLTIADFSLVATVTSADVLVPISSNKFPKVTAWISKMQALPYYAEANQKGLDKFTELIKSKLA